ncbi:hypothetical protein E2C01_001373 [Portunus trituberculatus]|uniref:Uncharacterized protein n=1 Tax=Portunus trituberculatus TaxID=210409 RepID=A0A5B7CJ43_PORTR|nr:hypothetical protein [Portunus trituberculatus]
MSSPELACREIKQPTDLPHVSSTERPTGRSLMLMCRTTPSGSMRNSPRRATPSPSNSTP